MEVVERYRALSGSSAGVWFGTSDPVQAGDSWKIVNGEYGALESADTFSPQPSHYFVKFGGDFGTLWGTPESRAALLAAYGNRIIPYLFVRPDYADNVPNLVATLRQEGYPIICLNVEEQWENHWYQFASMLNQCDPYNACLIVAGYAWFGWSTQQPDIQAALQSYPVLYAAEAYFSVLTLPRDVDERVAWVRDQLDAVTHAVPVSIVLDSASLETPAFIDYAAGGNGLSVWYNATLTQEQWTALFQTYNPVALEPVVSPKDEALTNLGQALEWLSTVLNDYSASENVNTDIVNRLDSAIVSVKRAHQVVTDSL